MKRLALILGSSILLIMVLLASLDTAVQAGSVASGEIVLVAGDVIDIRWDPSQYPNPHNEPLIRWELYRREPDGFRLVTSGTGTNKDSHRDKKVPLGITVSYYLDVIRDGADGQMTYRAFTTQTATTGKLYGTVLEDLELSPGSFEVVGTTVISSGVTLSMKSHTTLAGPQANVPARVHVDGGLLQVEGGTLKNSLLLQYGTPGYQNSEGYGFIHNAIFDGDSSAYRPVVQIYSHSDQSYDFVGNKNLTLEGECIDGKSSLRIQDNKGASRITTSRSSTYRDCALDAEIKKNEDVLVNLKNTKATITNNPVVVVRLADAAEASIKSNAYVKEISANVERDNPDATERSKIAVENNPKVGWVTLYDRADASIVNNVLVDGPIEIEATSTAVVQDNKITGRLWVTGYGTKKATKAKAIITGNTFSFPYQNTGVHVYDGAKMEVVGNTLEWTGFHGSESTVLMAAAGQGTELLADGNTLLGGKILVYDRAKVHVTWNVVKGRGGFKGGAITIGCVVCNGDVEGIINHNTVQEAWGFEVWHPSPRLQIQHNCIRGNDPGLMTDDFVMPQPVDMRYNWWGDPSGPYHKKQNPGGAGDKIVGEKVLFKPWDLTGSSCRDTPPPPQLNDLSLAGMEVVQVVQTLQNDVPLVAGKPAVVRVYPRSVAPAKGVTARLNVYRAGKLLATLRPEPESVGTAWLTDPAPMRANSKKSLNFALNPGWVTAGSLTLQAELNPLRSPVERDYGNNVISKTVTFQERRTLNILYVPINHQIPPGSTNLPDNAAIQKAHTYMRTIYPHARIEFKIANPLPWDKDMTHYPYVDRRRNVLHLYKALEDTLTQWNSQPGATVRYDQVVGIFKKGIILGCLSSPRNYELKIAGTTYVYKGRGQVSMCVTLGTSIAHEAGHNLGLQHPDAPGSVVISWPISKEIHVPPNYWSKYGYKTPKIQEYGWDFRPANERIFKATPAVDAEAAYDFMTYREPEWISPLHYRMLFDANGEPQPFQRLAKPQTYLLVSGDVTIGGEVTFNTFWPLTTDQPPLNPPEGSGTCIDLRDDQDSTLASRCFDLAFTIPDGFIETDIQGFNIALPRETGTTRVVLRQGSSELGSVEVSENAPTVQLLAPNGGGSYNGSIFVSWNADDVDGDTLVYNLYYSSDDGASWQPALLNISGATSANLDLAGLPGGEKARLRIEASDGFHLASDTSDGPFTVADQAPAVGITFPEDGGEALLPLSLTGYAYDAEDGELPGESLAWTSDVTGALGTGGVLEIGQLPLGPHTLTLTATDSKGSQASDSVTVLIKDLRVFLPNVLSN